MISNIKDAINENDYGELASKLGQIAATVELNNEIRISNGFVLSFNELNRLLEPISDRVTRIISSEASIEEKHAQFRELLANHHMPENMKTEILGKYNTLITDLIEKIPKEAQHIISGIREKAHVNIRASTLSKTTNSSFSNIVGDAELIHTIMKSWYSAFSVQSLQNIRNIDEIKIGIIVQKTLDIEKIGQIVTDEPISGDFSDNEVVLLAEIGNKIQNMFGEPQIIEFGFLRGRVFIISCYDKPIEEPQIQEEEMQEDIEQEESFQQNTVPIVEKEVHLFKHSDEPINEPVKENKITTIKQAQQFVKEFAERNQWQDIPNIDKFDHLHEELIEMTKYLRYKNEQERIDFVEQNKHIFIDGIGDLFFGVCRLANQLGIDMEAAFDMVSKEILEKYDRNHENRFFN